MLQLRLSVVRTASLVAMLFCCLPPSAIAVLQVYEGFNYADGTNIVGQNGGGGWANAWNATGTASTTETATTPGLTYPGLNSTLVNNKLSLAGQQTTGTSGNNAFIFRSVGASNNFGADGSTTWLSFIGQRTGTKSGTHSPTAGPTYERIFGISFFQGGTASATDERWSVGELTPAAAAIDPDTWTLSIFPTVEIQATAAPIDVQSFLLVRVDYGIGTGADNAYLWVNPDLSAGEPAIGSQQATLSLRNLEFDRIRVSAGGSQSSGALLAASGFLDEIRIGNSFASVIGPGLIPGDVNGDLAVDISDYNVIRDHFQASGVPRTQGDLNGDGNVNFVDFRIWKNNRTAGSGSYSDADLLSGLVPEPSSLMLFLFALIALVGRRFIGR